MTLEILNMMEERKSAKENTQKYNQIHRNIHHKIREIKNLWLASQCSEAEELQMKHAAFHFHNKLRKISSRR